MLIDAKQAFLQEDEQALITRCVSGCQHAFRDLFSRHEKRVYALSLRLTADPHSAEDVCQEVFVQVWNKLDQFNGQSQFSTWLHSVTSNIAISYLRKQKNWLQRVVSFEEEGMEQADVESCPMLGGLDKLIVRLPERARLVFVLHAVEGYRHEEIADLMGMAVGSSKAQYHRARQLMQEWYENE
ncbi:RNA polymerase sigma factor [Pseudoalteromonas xiamenensis]|jgi:RNA polymerase sigma factor (sigma-70 family)|uniref:Sigma-70 family RNA polymerase sigma factor n=1 Tax=Pseudoalteromonas xiamenensis TaxID=882626 RepID=A0A975HK21_9GAMM|nr:sigma-70 family RNA polymerase sigma factor [Pseudoalteromonas xiamenensis]QTH70583.1 sigma-70 family RNA polymerase sigma factor [Pseudoalteromonas xiamenensis]WMN58855.1 sigma-70 family RNA polymerase sigma factor [Pseudoalteromonas xiamenensis]